MSFSTDIHRLPQNALENTPKRSRRIAIEEVDNPVLLEGIALWRHLCKGRKYPSRNDITPRVLRQLLRNTTLVKVVDGGNDYEYRIVGDAFVMAHGMSVQGRRWSDTAGLSAGYHDYIKPIYDEVVHDAATIATRGWIERGAGSKGHVWCEYVFLPLGEAEVDHILIFAAYVGRDGLSHIDGSFSGSFDN